ncbi:uncharacterized protein H6S33_009566 [Morchella sextelata]|uniref:uncharacterized protein n=1 Tax=Morchella sextelata TaxID=1174677 RepID=UPI001D057C07|nr:uncharacterized protein H6S33_009566 [Morchella sextelata]KAH0613186.1 hypothetical protein H6S33_009566 [Morchella sextelata]
MSATILGNPTNSDIPENQNNASSNHLVGGEIPHEVLRSLYLKDVTANGQTEGLVAFTRAQEDFPAVKRLNPLNKKRILVTGGAGFVGSHLVDRLMLMGHDVICVDNYFTGSKVNIVHWIGHPNFEMIRYARRKTTLFSFKAV